jgi:plasmid stability protein
MGQVLIRNLEDSVIDRWKTKAELRGHSLEQALRDLVTREAPLSREEKLDMLSRFRSSLGPQSTDSTDLIREDRDSR